jgi:hypothetical protein
MGVAIFSMSREEAMQALIAECPSARIVAKTGYAAKPGTGPNNETCKTCQHSVPLRPGAKTFYKCLLIKAGWTNSIKTDIKLKSPACSKWELADMYRRLREAEKNND